jgi:hypothetical protein
MGGRHTAFAGRAGERLVAPRRGFRPGRARTSRGLRRSFKPGYYVAARASRAVFGHGTPGLTHLFRRYRQRRHTGKSPEAGTFSLTLEGSLNHLTARLQRIYSKRIVTLGVTSPSENWALPDPADPSRILCRNLETEQLALEEVRRYGFTGPDSSGYFTLRGERSILSFFGKGYPALKEYWDVTLGPRFTNVSAEIERITPRVEIIRSGEQWFDLQFDLSTGSGERFSAAEVQRLLQLGQNHLRLKSGKVAVFDAGMLDDFQNVLRDCNPQQQQPGNYRIHKANAGYLESAAAGAGFKIKAGTAWRKWAHSQQGQAEITPMDLGDLEGTLRAYQKYGASWLSFLGANRLGGILADDMCLG